MMVGRMFERLIFASRWLMVPFFLGLVVALALLLIKFVQEIVVLALGVVELDKNDFILAVLTLLDLTLVGGLVLIVILAGYENFVSRLNAVTADDRPAWLGTLDLSGLKLTLIASIVAISTIDLLRAFLHVQALDKTDLAWLVAVQLTFVVSGVLLALMDWLTAKAKVLEKG
jgi:uncharacterized protein (TIGR00645 family)